MAGRSLPRETSESSNDNPRFHRKKFQTALPDKRRPEVASGGRRFAGRVQIYALPVHYGVYYNKGFFKLQAGKVSHQKKFFPASPWNLVVSPKYDRGALPGAGSAARLPKFLPFPTLFAKELVVNCLHCVIGIHLIQQDGNFNLTGGNHVDINIRIVQRTKHFSR